jgi:hypothetical protein
MTSDKQDDIDQGRRDTLKAMGAGAAAASDSQAVNDI